MYFSIFSWILSAKLRKKTSPLPLASVPLMHRSVNFLVSFFMKLGASNLSCGWTILCHFRRSYNASTGKQCLATNPNKAIDALWAVTFWLQLRGADEKVNSTSSSCSVSSASSLDSSSDLDCGTEVASWPEISDSNSLLYRVANSCDLSILSSSEISNSEDLLESTWWMNVRMFRLAETSSLHFPFSLTWNLSFSVSLRIDRARGTWLTCWILWSSSRWFCRLGKTDWNLGRRRLLRIFLHQTFVFFCMWASTF